MSFRSAGALLAALALVVGLAAPAAAYTPREYAAGAFASVAHARHRADLPKVTHDDCLDQYATRQARRMARHAKLYHQDMSEVAASCDMAVVGEVVAFGFTSGRQAVRKGFLKSQPHREVILDRQYRLMGVGARQSGNTWYISIVVGKA